CHAACQRHRCPRGRDYRCMFGSAGRIPDCTRARSSSLVVGSTFCRRGTLPRLRVRRVHCGSGDLPASCISCGTLSYPERTHGCNGAVRALARLRHLRIDAASAGCRVCRGRINRPDGATYTGRVEILAAVNAPIAAPLTLVLGGARSGKSSYAESLITAFPPPWTYVAPAEPRDAEMAER